MQIKNTENQYGLITIFFHWFMATIIIGLLVLGLYMVRLPISHEKLKFYGWHKEFGFLILGLFFLRVAWRFINTTPRLLLPWWEKLAAHSMHGALYIFMFAMPLTGWLITSAAGLPASFFGLFVMPNLISPNEELRLFFQTLHQWMGYALTAAISLHTSAALKHHFINKDNILRRIFP